MGMEGYISRLFFLYYIARFPIFQNKPQFCLTQNWGLSTLSSPRGRAEGLYHKKEKALCKDLLQTKEPVSSIAGTFFICDCSGESFGSLSKEQQKRYQ